MGLAERRAAAAFEKEKFPALKQAVSAAAGYDLPIEVTWADLAKEGYAESYDVAYASNFFVPLTKAFERICIDDMGKEALKDKVKKVTCTSKRNWSSLEVTLDGGTLNLDADPSYNRDDSCVQDYTDRIVSYLEAKL